MTEKRLKKERKIGCILMVLILIGAVTVVAGVVTAFVFLIKLLT